MSYLGRCLVNHTTKILWINIPKNASNSISSVLLKQGWKNDNWLQNPTLLPYKMVVVIRDPITRWRGSTIELCYHHLQANNFLQHILDEFPIWFNSKLQQTKFTDFGSDLHHWPQTTFLESATNITYVLLEDENFSTNIQKALGLDKPITAILNQTATTKHKDLISIYVDEFMDSTIIQEKIKEFYKEDFELIEKIKNENYINSNTDK